MSMDDGVKRIAYGYTRVSTEEQTFGASLENQRLAIQKYARQNNINLQPILQQLNQYYYNKQ